MNSISTKVIPTIFRPIFKKKYLLGFAAVIIIIIIVALVYKYGGSKQEGLVPPNPTKKLPPSASTLHFFNKAAVCADGVPCAEIGK